MERVIGIDYGTKRLGIAVSGPLGCIAQPLPFVDATPKKAMLAAIGELLGRYQAKTVVLGLPRHMSGDEGDSAAAARALGEAIAARHGVTVEYIDERLTTAAAQRLMIEADVSRRKRKQKVDSLATAMILQTWLDRRGSGPTLPPMQ